MRARSVWILAMVSLIAYCRHLDAASATVVATNVTSDPISSDYLLDTWTSEDGLPQNSITSIVQTPDGYMWLGTFNGVVRFDGVNFTVFNAINTPELKSSRIVRLCSDRFGQLWSASQEGDVTFLSHGRFTHVGTNFGLPTDDLGLIGADPDGNVWLRVNRGGKFFRMQEGRFVPMPPLQAITATNYPFLKSDSLINLWVRKGNDWLAGDTGDVAKIEVQDDGAKTEAAMLGPSRRGGIWFETPRSLLELSHGQWTRRIATAALAVKGITLLEDKDGNVWLPTWAEGLIRYGADGTMRRFDLAGSPQPLAVRAICEDTEGNLWVGLDGGGLCRLRRRVFQTYGVNQGLRGHLVRAAVEDTTGTFWILDQEFIDWLHPNRTPLIEHSKFDAGTPWCALPGRNGEVWIGARSGKVFRCRHEDLTVVQVNGRRPINCAVLFEQRDGTLWMGAENGLWRLEGEAFEVVPKQSGLEVSDVRAMTEDKAGHLYVGFNGGGLWKRSGTAWTRLGAAEGLQDNRVWALYADSEDTIWIGSDGDGISCLRHGKVFHFKDPKLALPGLIAFILEDDAGYLWIGSNQGVYRISRQELIGYAEGAPTSSAAVQFGRSDGIESPECADGSQPVAWKARDGQIWFSTVKGVSVVNPKNLQLNTNSPPVVIESLLADDRIYSQFQSATGLADGTGANAAAGDDWKSHLTMPAGTDRIEIRYTALTYTAPTKARFRYWLEGFDTDWEEADTKRIATYTHVPPGHYRFRVIACNSDGVWNKAGAALVLTVLPRFYQTWWFKMAVAGSIAGLVFLAYRLRVGQLEELSRLRLRIASDLHDEVGSNLGSIALNSELLQGNPEMSEEDRQELGEITRVASQTAQSVREITWLINPGFDTLPQMAERMKIVAASMLSTRQYEFVAPPSFSPRKLSLEFRRHVFLIFKEILHNIVKHSGATRVEIRLEEHSGRIELLVRDNGRGFDETSVRHGHGLASLRRRAEALGGDLQIKSELGSGACVRLGARIK